MKMKKPIIIILIAIVIVACVGIAIEMLGSEHEHSFGEWKTETPASCAAAEVEVRTCKCGEKETREGDPATGHTYTSISAESKLEKPMASMEVQVSDLSVTSTCGKCKESVAIIDGIELEGAKLALGENTITVKYGDLSTTLTIQAAELDIALDGIVVDDTYVYSSKKDDQFTKKKEMGTKSDLYRIYLRVNVKDILHDQLFLDNKDNAKVQLAFAITGGTVTEKTTFTLKAYKPAEDTADVDFAKLTWNSVDNKEGSVGAYSQLNWNNGTVLVSSSVGHNVSADGGNIIVTLGYSQIADCIDGDGNILLAFATNTSGLKVGSLENKTETNKPAVKVILNDEHFHIFDQEVADSKFFVSANCKEKTKYYMSCSCGAAGTEIFKYGEIISHSYSKLIPEQSKTCTTDGVKAHHQCTRCGKYFLDRDGQMKLVKAEDLKLSAGHDYKEIPQKDATCTEAGNHKYYKCGLCGKYFDAQKNETTKEAQKLQKLEHTYGDLLPEQAKSCTEDGVKAHYECEACGKTFLEKDGEKVLVKAEDLKISAGHDMKVIGAKEPTCTKDGNNKYYQCRVCSKYFIDKEGTSETTKDAQKIEALGHAYTSISATSNLDNPMATMVVTASDLNVTGTCGRCGESFAIVEGIELEGATLTLGENVVTVKYGALSTTVTIEATELIVALAGTVTDDTYVYSSSKNSEYTEKNELSTYSSSFRTYFRVNLSDILENQMFLANRDNAKVQLVLTVTSGSVSESTTFTLKAYEPAAGITDVAFSEFTWNSVNNKEGSVGAYSQLNWGNGTELAASASVDNGKVIITLDYSQIADYVDTDGNILLAFATNTSGLKVGSLENATESNRPAFKIVLNEASSRNQKAARQSSLISVSSEEKVKCYKSLFYCNLKYENLKKAIFY